MSLFNPSDPYFSLIVLAMVLWTLPWKGYALWLAARNKHLVWFVVLLVMNTLAILEIIYIFGFGRPAEKKNSPDVQ